MNALLFSNLFPTAAEPTRGIFTLQLARELAKLCELHVAVPIPWFPRAAWAHRLLPEYGRRFGRVEPVAGSPGVTVSFPRYPLIPKISDAQHSKLMWLGVHRQIELLHRRVGLDVINAHWLYPDGVVAARVAARLGIPVVLTALGCDVNDFLLVPALRSQILAALRAASAVTAVSAPLADALTDAGVPPARISVIPNGVDTSRFRLQDSAVARTALGLSPGDPLIVCVSRLSAEKGVRYLLSAAALLKSRMRGVRIAIVGDGEERESLEALAAEGGVQDTTQFVGAVPHEDVATWLSAATVVCMPSVREGHPNAAMEALACGRPLVASRVGALPSMISSGTGLLVPPADPGALAEALEQALTQSWDADKIAASVRAASWEGAARAYAEVLISVARPAALDSVRTVGTAG